MYIFHFLSYISSTGKTKNAHNFQFPTFTLFYWRSFPIFSTGQKFSNIFPLALSLSLALYFDSCLHLITDSNTKQLKVYRFAIMLKQWELDEGRGPYLLIIHQRWFVKTELADDKVQCAYDNYRFIIRLAKQENWFHSIQNDVFQMIQPSKHILW